MRIIRWNHLTRYDHVNMSNLPKREVQVNGRTVTLPHFWNSGCHNPLQLGPNIPVKGPNAVPLATLNNGKWSKQGMPHNSALRKATLASQQQLAAFDTPLDTIERFIVRNLNANQSAFFDLPHQALSAYKQIFRDFCGKLAGSKKPTTEMPGSFPEGGPELWSEVGQEFKALFRKLKP